MKFPINVGLYDDNGLCYIGFQYNKELVDVIHGIPGAYFDRQQYLWILPILMLKVFFAKVKRFKATIGLDIIYNIDTRIIDMLKVDKDIDLGSIDLKSSLYDYQEAAVKCGIINKKFILGDEAGLGKTLEIIALTQYLREHEGLKRILVICCINGNKYNWLEETLKHSNMKAHILGSRYKKRTGRLDPGGLKETVMDLRELPNAQVLIMNKERLIGGRVKRKRGQRKTIDEFPIVRMLQQLIDKGEIGLIAVDEFHKLSAPTSAQSQALLWLNCERQIAMTGTLITNSPMDLYVPFKWMGWELRDYWNFQNRYTIKDGWGSVIGYQNVQELIDVLSVYQLRRLKKNVLNLPEKICKVEYVDMSNNEWKVYKAVQSGILHQANGEETNPKDLRQGLFVVTPAMNPMTMSLRLRQATAATEIVSDVIHESSKMDRMEDIVAESILNGEKVIIFSNWTTVTNIVRDRLCKYNPAYIIGEVDDDTRNKERLRFQEDDNCKVIIGTIPAMGTGYTLTAASVVIFMDEPWTEANRSQAEDRAYRVGTKKTVTVYYLVCKDTVDEHVHDIVEQKGDVADLVIDGTVNPNKKKQLFKMLVGADPWSVK